MTNQLPLILFAAIALVALIRYLSKNGLAWKLETYSGSDSDRPFDETQWRENPGTEGYETVRLLMSKHLLKTRLHPGTPRAEIHRLIGPPEESIPSPDPRFRSQNITRYRRAAALVDLYPLSTQLHERSPATLTLALCFDADEKLLKGWLEILQ